MDNETPTSAAPPPPLPPPPPRYAPVTIPTPEHLVQEEFMNNCGTRTVVAGVMGGLLGSVFGVFMGTADLTTESATGQRLAYREIARNTARGAASKSWSYAKGFSTMGALYSGSECVVEKVRAKHDSVNSAAAGCFTGGVLARNAGWQGALGGCATFAAFSVLMDTLLDH